MDIGILGESPIIVHLGILAVFSIIAGLVLRKQLNKPADENR